jgi:radical SAM protein with 4Fe4S-binding SPASM domain
VPVIAKLIAARVVVIVQLQLAGEGVTVIVLVCVSVVLSVLVRLRVTVQQKNVLTVANTIVIPVRQRIVLVIVLVPLPVIVVKIVFVVIVKEHVPAVLVPRGVNKPKGEKMKYFNFSPWVFVTYSCSCNCPYCMVPKIEAQSVSMSSETFEKMLRITENMLEKGISESVSFRLSGGEPFLVWENYADLVTKYRQKYPKNMFFGVLSNLVRFDSDMAKWMLKNDVSIQVSLDDMENSKPLNNGESSSSAVIKNIEKLRETKIPFSINTVFDHEKTKDIRKIVDYICEINPSQWGFSSSYSLEDDTYIGEIIDTTKLAILRLITNGFDVRNRFRYYNEVINQAGMTCTAGVNLFALGTNLEVWPCQSMIDQKPLGCFDENIQQLLETSDENKYFQNRTLLPQCTDCSVLNWCRGGCRALHKNKKVIEVTCKIKQEIIPFVNREIYKYPYKGYNSHSHSHQSGGDLDEMVKKYAVEALKAKPMFVKTPPLPDQLDE